MESDLKADVESLIDEITRTVNINVSAQIVSATLRKFYLSAIEDMETKFDMNFTMDEDKLKFLTTYTFDNIKDLNNYAKESLRKELSQGIMNLEGVDKLQERIKDVMDTTKNRARLIARTEANRALNMASLDAARQSGLNIEKKWLSKLDDKTSQVCKDLDGKQIPLNEKFSHKGELYDSPPAHPNCRSTLQYIQVKS